MRGTASAAGSPDPAPPAVRPPGHAAPPAGRRRTIALLLAATVVVGAAAMFGPDLLPGGAAEPAEPARPLSPAEADRLAGMRQHNWQDGRAGVRATVGDRTGQVHLTGWVDWRRPMVYLARSGPTPDTATELVQAVPGLVASRPGPAPPAATGSPGVADPHPPPPVPLPARGWRLRHPGADGPAGAPSAPGTIDALVVLLLLLTAEQPDPAGLLAGSEAQWLRQDRTAGYAVDVLLGPAVPPSAAPAGGAPDRSLAAMGGAVQYWLDDRARLHRLVALLAPGTQVRVDLDRDDHTAPPVLDLLGGAAVDPRPVTADQLATLTRLRQRNQATGGGAVRLVLPAEDGAIVRGTGWLDWERSIGYLVKVRDGAPDGLLWADRTGVATRPGEPEPAGGPPLPAPPDPDWHRSRWEDRGDEHGGFDLDLLLHEALSLSHWQPDQPEALPEQTRWLRADELAGSPVDVYEVPRPVESDVAPGGARLRYWVDRDSGVLRRLEIRTRSGGYGQLDLDPAPVPYLGWPGG